MSKYDDPEKEFFRGYNFGKEEGATEVIKMIVKHGGAIADDLPNDAVLVRLPKEYFQELKRKAKELL